MKQDDNSHAKYYIKSRYNMHKSSAKYHNGVDLRELFVYKLLENLRVGPPVHFILNTHDSKFGLFIATEAGWFLNLNDFVNFLN